jgi:hypothetical protein
MTAQNSRDLRKKVMSDAVYPYRIHYPRTSDWWDGGWAKLSSWCNECFEPGEWNYYSNSFVFSHEKDYMLFKLKWL